MFVGKYFLRMSLEYFQLLEILSFTTETRRTLRCTEIFYCILKQYFALDFLFKRGGSSGKQRTRRLQLYQKNLVSIKETLIYHEGTKDTEEKNRAQA